MTAIKFVDVSVRDGNQSLWGAVGLRNAQVLQIAPVMNRVGFAASDFTSSTAMGMSVKMHSENPWERLRRARRAMPDTPLQLIGTGFRFISWEIQSQEFMQLVYDRLVANGVSRFIVLDPMHDIDAMFRTAATVKRAGGEEVVAALIYTISDVHDDRYYAQLAEKLRSCPDIDRFYVKDPSGLLSAERARTLLPTVRAAIGDAPLELHSHCTIGQAPLTYMEAARVGIDALHVGCGALGSGSSLPEARRTLENLKGLGFQVDVNEHALYQVCDYFDQLAQAEGQKVGGAMDFDASFLQHQVAGGVMSTTRRQLAELGLEHKFDEVITEVNRVRQELGYPIMVTPFPQMVCSQALYNVIGSERYDNVADQIILYALGRFGRPNAPIDEQVLDKILNRPRARELQKGQVTKSLKEIRQQFSSSLSDDEFLLRAVMPQAEVDAMLANGPSVSHYNGEAASLKHLLQGLNEQKPAHFFVRKGSTSLTLTR